MNDVCSGVGDRSCPQYHRLCSVNTIIITFVGRQTRLRMIVARVELSASGNNTLHIVSSSLIIFSVIITIIAVVRRGVHCYWSGDIFTRPRGPGEREIIKYDRDGCYERQDDDNVQDSTRPAPIPAPLPSRHPRRCRRRRRQLPRDSGNED